ncbi:MAG: sigma-70 family RNA polymerase sigma factor [Acetobacteraceae bacterium]|nr:sigma-70 family RNA polymerase sigma factor [Acetobacteraceae bacterium]
MQRARRGDRLASERLLAGSQGYLQALARRFEPLDPGLRDELLQAGRLGVLVALGRFDPGRRVRLMTYALPFALGEMRRCLEAQRPVRLGPAARAALRRVREARAALSQSLGREPTLPEVARHAGLPGPEVAALLAAAQPALPLDAHRTGPGLGDALAGTNRLMPGPEAEVDEGLAVREALGRLPPRERKLLLWRYYCGRTQREAAGLLGLAQPQVSRLERRALCRLRRLLESG